MTHPACLSGTAKHAIVGVRFLIHCHDMYRRRLLELGGQARSCERLMQVSILRKDVRVMVWKE
jgi:hypothetical protein